ncbi:hypothetical protein AVEN_117845-1 [Araneus ventricosus]|uniref:Uncharacterized protein n=1 Tax=Araneus ventricosus TaxID=182803 RepID=A0A4Y2RK75_ARAVE|nr:hypothetical protein AVEN_117845-1 [Araneus ventricosus]
MLDSMRMADRAWMNVTQKKIKNCFEKACFSSVESDQMRSRNSTQKHTNVKNGRRFQKSSTFLKRQRLKNLWCSTRRFKCVDYGLMMRSFLKQFLRLRVMRKWWMFQQTPTLLRVRLKMLFTSCSWNVQNTWKKRISQLFFGWKT